MKPVAASLALITALTLSAGAQTSCPALAQFHLANGVITSATLIEAGKFIPPPHAGPPPPDRTAAPNDNPAGPAPSGPPSDNDPYPDLPQFCRVRAALHPTADSDIRIEVWLPKAGWTHRVVAVGNGAFNSDIMLDQLARAVLKGYAATGSNTGHEGNTSEFAIGHPEKLKDWGYRAVHEDIVAAKSIAAAFYGDAPKYSYWSSCSTGGRQGWVAAEYYPDDFDGLAIGDPANPMTRLQAGSIWANLAVNQDEASFIPAAKWTAIHTWAMDKCDAKDGLKDGLMENPLACHLDVQQLACKPGAETPECLTAPQLTALRKVVGGAHNPRTGELIYPGYPLGIAMGRPIVGKQPDDAAPATFQALFQDPSFDYHHFNFDTDITRSDKLGDPLMNAVDPSRLRPLFAHGGKMLLYHGWNDPAIPAPASIMLYTDAVKANGGLKKTYDSIRLFLVPGMNHCGGGEGPNTFDKLDVLSEWVEQGKAPDSIVASHSTGGHVDRTRPLCPYPQIAKYSGSGSIDKAENFSCGKP